MTDMRETFAALESAAGEGFEGTVLWQRPQGLATAIRQARRRRAALSAVGTAAAVGAVGLLGVGVVQLQPLLSPAGGEPGVSTTSSPAPHPHPSSLESTPAASDAASDGPSADPTASEQPWCNTAQGIPGIPVSDTFGGMEGWWNSSDLAPCDEWELRVQEHPDTVLINTGNTTMIEAYWRTSRDVLDAYAALAPNFVVVPPAEGWPADSIILVDAVTGEVLETWPLPAGG